MRRRCESTSSPCSGNKVDELRPTDMRRLPAALRKKEASGHGAGRRKLSPRMVQSAHAVVRNVLPNALREELISRNSRRWSTSRTRIRRRCQPRSGAVRALLMKIAADRLFTV
ncbi:hypothetical protein GCM10009610_00660 [Pseudonocardia xinjiangensis]